MPHIEAKAELHFARLGPTAVAPSKGSEYAAGFDLYSAYDYSIAPGARVCAMTDIQVFFLLSSSFYLLTKKILQVAVPEGCYGRVAPRSGLALKHGIDTGAGVIDADYR